MRPKRRYWAAVALMGNTQHNATVTENMLTHVWTVRYTKQQASGCTKSVACSAAHRLAKSNARAAIVCLRATSFTPSALYAMLPDLFLFFLFSFMTHVVVVVVVVVVVRSARRKSYSDR
jgi:hypothetical protein